MNPRPLTVATAVTVPAVGVITAISLWSAVTDASPALIALDAALAVVSLAVSAWVLRAPVAGGVAAGLLTALSPVVTPVAGFAVLHTARSRPLRQALTVTLAGVAGQAAQGLWRPVPGLAYPWWLLLMALAYAAVLGWGVWAQARRNLLDEWRDRARRAEEQQRQRVEEARRAERTRIAREMHDVLAHRLSLLATYAGAFEYRPDAPPERMTAAAGVIRDSAHRALDELRQVITLLHRDDPADDADAPTAAHDAAGIHRLIEEARAAGQSVSVDGTPPDADLAYRIVREALTNARKHASGAPVSLIFDGAVITVRNRSGPGGTRGAGTGLIGLAERVELAGGALTHETVDGRFQLTATLPEPA
ncbi:sensor histidine kinase [Catenuloplanes japonicus]|uniref:sensor histidine kinase n=1 Tax=Catenuloplanes japonicus TaxID=33876 RepID=UPI001E418E9B|nr:histidine kinase [Catenuloplanes japonicus]